MSADTTAGQQRPPWWRNVRTLRIVGQAAFLAVVAGFLYLLYFNLVSNMLGQGIDTSFDYLPRPAGFGISGSGFSGSQSVLAAIGVGIKNTALVSLIGIVIATILGTIIGVMRLSTNWLVARAASLYVEAFRNIPVLIIIIFWYVAVVLKLPRIETSIEWFDTIVLSNRGLWVPWVQAEGGLQTFWGLVAGALVAAGAVAWWRTRHHEETGERHHRVLWGVGVLVAVLVLGYLALGRPFGLTVPERTARDVVGGIRMTPEYAALLLALSLYTASHIAEIVRGSIQSVPKGQTEAATAVGLSSFQRLRFVILPQAFRVAVPPVANQYLNLTKNSSLGVAIAFPEITSITRIVIGNGNPAPQSIAVLMGIYLVFSLSISAVTNVINRRLQLAER